MKEEINFEEKIDYIIKTLTDINRKHVDETVINELSADNSITFAARDAAAIAQAYPNYAAARALADELGGYGGFDEFFDDLVRELEAWEELEDNTPAKDKLWEDIAGGATALEENAGMMLPLAEKVKAMLLKEKGNTEKV